MSTAQPTAAIVIIGAEVLSGKVADANGPFLIRVLRERGVQVVEMRTIGDDPGVIAETVRALKETADYVFTTGGVGPTHDDVTIAGIARAFGVGVVRHPQLYAQLVQRYGDALSPAHLKMTEVPEGSTISCDATSFVPVVQLGNVIVLPGVPSLMRQCFTRVADGIGGSPFFSGCILLDISESKIAQTLEAIQQAHPEVAIGSYPRFDEAPYRVKVTVDGRDAALVRATLKELLRQLDTAWVVGTEGP